MTKSLRIARLTSLKSKNSNKELTFEESLARLEALVQEMESGDLPLENILCKYEEGNRLIKFCAAKLNEAEKRIEVLMKEKDGSLELQPFNIEEEEPEREPEEAESKKRNSRSDPKEKPDQNDLF